MIEAREYDLASVVRETGVACSLCGDGRCARPHARRYRKRVQDLSSGEVHEHVPIVRVILCDGSTVSLMPAELWRGGTTTSSVLETVARSERDGVGAALEWTSYATDGDIPISERTLIRWRSLVRSRVVGSALSVLPLDFHWSAHAAPGPQLEILLDRLGSGDLLSFRALTGRGLLDSATRPRRSTRSSSRRVPGRLVPSPPPDPSSAPLPRGSRFARSGRGPPRRTRKEGGNR